MYVVFTSVFLLFALIFLGFYIGKREIVRQEAAADLSNLILRITMPVTVFCSIVSQSGDGMLKTGSQVIVGVILLLAFTGLMGMLVVHFLHIPDKEKGVWIYTCMLSNNGFMGLPLALSIYGSVGMFYMALSNVVTNFVIFSLGIRLLTKYYPVKESFSLKKMILNNINLAVVIGLIVYLLKIPMPDLLNQLFSYISNITSGLSMIVVGLSLSRMPLKAVFQDRKMFFLTGMRLLILPFLVILILRILPCQIDSMVKNILILTAALPVSSAQSMITEQYGTNRSGASRSIFLTTLFSVLTVPLLMMFA